jgi:hypothetical protein
MTVFITLPMFGLAESKFKHHFFASVAVQVETKGVKAFSMKSIG